MRTEKLNLIVLSVATALNRTAAPMVVLAGALSGLMLAPEPVWATLPVSLVVVGMGACSYPAAALMRKIGRRAGFVLGTLIAVGGALLAALCIWIESFGGFCLAMLALGANQAFVQQYRFAAAENVPRDRVSYAVSLMLLSSLVSAYAGPELARVGRDWIQGAPFAGGFVGLAVLQGLAAALLLGYREGVIEEDEVREPERPLGRIVGQADYLLAAAAAGLSYAVMSLIMTAAPLSMHSMQGHSLDATAWAIEGHIVAMYLPSLITGTLIAWWGVHRIMTIGVLALGACVAVAVWRQGAIHYGMALVLLGLGWNFLFTAGSTLITTTYRPSERFKAQGINDLIVFGTMALVTLAAGALLQYAGWRWLVLSTTPMLVLMLALIAASSWKLRRRPAPAELGADASD